MYERRSDRLEVDAFIGARIVNGRSSLFSELLPGVANIAQKISLLGDSPKNTLKQEVPISQSSENNNVSQPVIPTDNLIININPSGQNIIIETLVNGDLKPLVNPINVIITDNKTNIVHIDEPYVGASTVINLNTISTFSVAFSQSDAITELQNEKADLQSEYDSLSNNTAYNLNRKSEIQNSISTINLGITALQEQIMNVNVTVKYDVEGQILTRNQSFTIQNNELS
jgi:hypothetical protein